MKNLKETSRGITLIALVITIIILIILATVTISTVFGDSGLISQAEYARDVSANATVAENEGMNSLFDEFTELTGGSTSGAKTLVQAFNDGEIAVGDYVNYTPTAGQSTTVTEEQTGYAEEQTFTTDTSTTWRVLGLSEDGQHLLLTSGSPIKKDGEDPYLVLQGAEGYLYCEDTLDTIAGIYNNSSLAEETRSMRIEDITRVLGGVTVTYPEEGEHDTGTVTLNADESNTNIGQTTSYPSYTYDSSDYTPEGAIETPPQHATAGTTVDADAWMFMYTTDGETRADYISERVYDMLFADTTESSNYAKSYWLASPGVFAGSGFVDFGPGAVGGGFAHSGGGNLFVSDGGWVAYGFTVRPVVVLKSDITIEQIQKIDDQTEETWNTTGGGVYGSGSIGS